MSSVWTATIIKSRLLSRSFADANVGLYHRSVGLTFLLLRRLSLLCSTSRGPGGESASSDQQQPSSLTFPDWLELLSILACHIAGQQGAGELLGVPQPQASFTAGAPWPPLDALCCLLNAMYSRGARFGSDSAPSLRAAVSAVRARIQQEEGVAEEEEVGEGNANLDGEGAGGGGSTRRSSVQLGQYYQQPQQPQSSYYRDGGLTGRDSIVSDYQSTVIDDEAEAMYAQSQRRQASSSSPLAGSGAHAGAGGGRGFSVRAMMIASGPHR